MRHEAYPPEHSRPKAREGQTKDFIARNSQAYFDKGHPDHQRVVQEAARLAARETAAQQRPTAPPPAGLSITKAALRAYIAANAPAYFDRSNPRHAEVAQRAEQLSQQVREETP